MLIHDRNFKAAQAAAKRAIELEPSEPVGYLSLASVMVWTGRGREAVREMKIAMRINPNHSWIYTGTLGFAHFVSGQYERAATLLEEATRRNPEAYNYLAYLAATYGYLELLGEARKAISEVQSIRRRLKKNPMQLVYLTDWPFEHNSDREHYRVGLTKAGLE